MGLPVALSVLALVASVILVFTFTDRTLPGIAVAVSGIEVMRAFRWIQLGVVHVPLALVLGSILAAVGLAMLFKAAGKMAISAATCAVLVGALQTLTAVGWIR